MRRTAVQEWETLQSRHAAAKIALGNAQEEELRAAAELSLATARDEALESAALELRRRATAIKVDEMSTQESVARDHRRKQPIDGTAPPLWKQR